MIPIYKPYLPHYCLQFAHDALDSSWISSSGEYKEKSVNKLKEITGAKHVILTTSGTSAMHLVAMSVAHKHSITNIYVPNNVYVASWNCLLFNNYKWNIHALDCNLETWNAEYININDSDETLIYVVHNLGNIINVPELKKRYPKSIFIEDNCEGLFGKYSGYYSGTESLCSGVSFFGNKNITTGQGGAFFTNDDDIYEFAYKTHQQGQTDELYVHDIIGYNYRMSNVQAAILYGQLMFVDEILDLKKKLFDRYRLEFSNIDGIKMQTEEDNSVHSNWMMGVRVGNNPGYEETKKFFNDNDVDIRPMFHSVLKHQHLSGISVFDTKNADILSKEAFMVPSYPELKKHEITHIIKTVKNYVQEIK